VKDNEVRGTCSMHGRDDKFIQNLRKSERTRAFGKLSRRKGIILEWILGK